MESKSDIGVIGLAVMGANLALNMERNGFQVSVYNHTPERTRKFMEHEGKIRISLTHTLPSSWWTLWKDPGKYSL
jgi:6-phosphogluconate dehydrogenase